MSVIKPSRSANKPSENLQHPATFKIQTTKKLEPIAMMVQYIYTPALYTGNTLKLRFQDGQILLSEFGSDPKIPQEIPSGDGDCD